VRGMLRSAYQLLTNAFPCVVFRREDIGATHVLRKLDFEMTVKPKTQHAPEGISQPTDKQYRSKRRYDKSLISHVLFPRASRFIVIEDNTKVHTPKTNPTSEFLHLDCGATFW
jgi:hypothetical protein